MTTIGFIGAGHIGSQLARLSVANGYDVVVSNSRGPETLSALVEELGPRARAGTSIDAARGGGIVVVSVPLKNYRAAPVEPLAGKIVIDANNYYPQRDGHICELADETRDDHHRRAPVGAPSCLEGRQGVQPHLCCRAHDAWPTARDQEPAGARHRRRRSGGQGHGEPAHRPVRLRHARRWPTQGGVAHPARHPRLRAAAHGRGAPARSRRGETLRTDVRLRVLRVPRHAPGRIVHYIPRRCPQQ